MQQQSQPPTTPQGLNSAQPNYPQLHSLQAPIPPQPNADTGPPTEPNSDTEANDAQRYGPHNRPNILRYHRRDGTRDELRVLRESAGGTEQSVKKIKAMEGPNGRQEDA